jgi:hypothetical protein
MAQYKYYLARSGVGAPHEIYRGDDVGFAEFANAGLWLAKKNGTWSDDPNDATWVCNLMMRGDFDPEDDEITEAQAMAYLDQWRSGIWPGRE